MNSIMRESAPHPLAGKVFDAISWWGKTLFYAVVAPWAMVGIGVLVMAALGVPLSTVRYNVVDLATLEPQAWTGLMQRLTVIAFAVSATVVGYRMLRSPAFEALSSWAGRQTLRALVALRDRLAKTFPALGNDKASLLVVGAVIALLAIGICKVAALQAPQQPLPPQSLLADPQEQQASVALHLKDGSIRSGTADVSANQDGTFTVRFKR